MTNVVIQIDTQVDDRELEKLPESVRNALKSISPMLDKLSGLTDRIPAGAKNAVSGLRNVGKAAADAGTSAQKSQGMFDGWLGGLAKLGLAGAGLGVVTSGVMGLAGAVGGMVSGNAEFETYETQLSTLMHSTEAAKERMAELAEFGANTPFELPELARAEKVMVTFGLTTGKSLELAGLSAESMRTIIGDAAAGSGRSFEDMAATFGKLSLGNTEALNSLQEAGVLTKASLANFGIEFNEQGEMLEKDAGKIFKAVTEAAKANMGGGMDALAGTFEGKMSTLSDAFGEIKRAVMAPIFDVAKASLDAILPQLQSLAGVASEVSKAFTTGGLDAGLAKLQELTGIDLSQVVTFFQDASTAIQEVDWGAVLDSAVKGLQSLWDIGVNVSKWLIEHKELVAAVVVALGAFSIISTVVGWIGGLVAMFGTASAGIGAAGGVLTFIVGLLGGPVTIAIGAIAILVGVLAAAWTTNFGGIQEKVSAVIGAVIGWLSKAKAWIDQLIQKFKAGDWGGIANQVIGMLAGGLRQGATLVGTAFRWLMDKAIEIITGVDWGGLAHQAIDMLVGMWKKEAHLVGLVFGTIIRLVMDVFTKTDWGGLARTVLDLLGKGVKMAGSLLVTAVVAVGKLAWDALVKTDWGKVANDILRGLAGGIKALAGMMLDIGRSIIDGIIAGITGGIGRGNDAMSAAVGSIHGTAKKATETSSPSKLYERLGLGWMLGAALGITRGAVSAIDAMRAAIAGVNRGAADELAKMDQVMRDFYANTLGPGGTWGRIMDLWAGTTGQEKFDMQFGHIDRKDMVKPPDFKDLTGDPVAAKKAWDTFWSDATAQEEKRNRTISDLIIAQQIRYRTGTNETMQGVWDKAEDIEKNRHNAIMAHLAAEQANEEKFWKAREDAIAAYQAALQKAQDLIQKAQAAAEQRESLISDRVLELIADQAEAWDRQHVDRMSGLAAEKLALEAAHTAAQAAFEKETAGWERHLKIVEDGVKAITDRGKAMQIQLGRLRIDLNIEGAERKLDGLQDRVSQFQSVLGKLDTFDSGDARGAAKRAAQAAREKIRVTTDEQRRMLESVKGTLTGANLRTAELLLQGHALSATKVRDLMALIEGKLQGQVDAQARVVSAAQAQVDALQQQITLNAQIAAEAGLAFEKEKARVQLILDAIGERSTAETAAFDAAVAAIVVREVAESKVYEAGLVRIEQLRTAEGKRHSDRMREIAEEYALELAKLEYTDTEIAQMVAAAAEQARLIGIEAERIFKGIGAAAAGAFDQATYAGDRTWKVVIKLNDELGTTRLVLTDIVAVVVKLGEAFGAVPGLVARANKALEDEGGGMKTERTPNFAGKRYRSDGTYTGAFSALLFPDGGKAKDDGQGGKGGTTGGGGLGIFKPVADAAEKLRPILEANIATPIRAAHEWALKLGEALKALPPLPPPGNVPGPGRPGGPGQSGMGDGNLQPTVLNLELRLTQPVQLDGKTMGDVIETILIRRGIAITLNPVGG